MMQFPRSLVHGSGVPMTLDPGRVLVTFKEDQDLESVESLVKRANAALERIPEPKRGQARRPLQTINHTSRQFWVRVKGAAGAAALEKSLQDRLAWIGPVYKLDKTKGLDGLLCPLPNVLLIRPARPSDASSSEALGKVVSRFGLKEIPEKSRYLNGFSYFVVSDPSRHSAYEIREALLREKDLVADVRFENMPLLGDSTLVPSDTLYPQQWNIAQIQGPQGWDYATGSASIVVAILDDGVETGHPDLDCLPGINLSTMMPTGDPGGNHGTACAGIAAARLNNMLGVAGVGGGCKILPLRRVNSSDVEAATGINWAADNGAHVISMSFGRYAAGEGFGPTGWDFNIIDPAIEHAWNDQNVVLCAATGNENTGTVNRYPARHPLVIACGASDQVDNRKSPASPDGENWGSNWGQQVYEGITTGVSVVAPGVLIPTTDRQGASGYNTSGGAAGNYFMTFNGTSAATPHVSGLAALVLSEKPSLTNAQVRTVIEKTADKVGTVPYALQAGFPNGTRNQQMGYGRINVYRALKSVQKTFFKEWKDSIIDKLLVIEKAWHIDVPKGSRWKEKEQIEEVKGMLGFENPELIDPRILVEISARLERLEKEVFKGRAFIRKAERPEVRPRTRKRRK
ncbi:MAG: S8 family serine peptidase [Deltaproteobacteria bacterium]|nr:S8 family serine peptidase [Deltaproteobacteria bacterium]